MESLLTSDTRRWWAHTKALAGLGKNLSGLAGLANLCCDGSLPALAEEINNFFESVCGDLQPLNSDLILPVCPVPEKYIIDCDTVSKLLKNININKAIGPDNIPN